MDARLGAAATGLLCLVVASGCASQREPDAQHAAVGFLRAADQGKGKAACAALAPRTRAELEQSAQMACEAAVLEAPLPRASAARSVQVSGEAAQVVLRTDTVFLSEFSDGWRIVAAGCHDRGALPYDCRVQGS